MCYKTGNLTFLHEGFVGGKQLACNEKGNLSPTEEKLANE
jgi:hypothetical protein